MPARVVLKPRRAKPFWFGEPWVFEGSIDRVKGVRDLTDGDVVEVRSDQGDLIGSGFWNGSSALRVRLVARGDRAVDEELIRERLRRAFELRGDAGLPTQTPGLETDAFRLVHAEGDALPGLIVDRFGPVAVAQFDSLGIRRFRDVVTDELLRLPGLRGVYERISRVGREEEGVDGEEGIIAGVVEEAPVVIYENGVPFHVDVRRGQKSGFFVDQRSNRLALAQYARGRSVLDAFCYTGGFGLTLRRHGSPTSITAIDSSRPALEVLATNAALDAEDVPVEVVPGNVLRYLDQEWKAGKRWGVVIVDPPKFVPRRSTWNKGMKLYRELNFKALRCVEAGGYLATCSCSGIVSEDDFREVVMRSAEEAKVRAQLVHTGGQGADHPVLLPHVESRYLKFHIYRVVPAEKHAESFVQVATRRSKASSSPGV